MTNGNDSAYAYGFCTANGESVQYSCGLTKREYFAALAMQGILANAFKVAASSQHMDIVHINTVSIEAVKYADAVIDELNKQEGTV